jgi:hypothetical protein
MRLAAVREEGHTLVSSEGSAHTERRRQKRTVLARLLYRPQTETAEFLEAQLGKR